MSDSYDYRTAAAVPSDFVLAKSKQAALEAECTAADAALKEVIGEHKGPMGLTPDHIKATPEYKAAKRRSELAFAALRAFNTIFVPRFKKELKAERDERHKRRTST